MLNDFSAQADMRSSLVLALGVLKLCSLLGQEFFCRRVVARAHTC